MSEQTVEIVYLPLRAGLDLESGAAKSAWDSTLATVAKQPGLKMLFWGRQIEDKSVAQIVAGAQLSPRIPEACTAKVTIRIVWASMKAHQDFMAAPEFQSFLDTLAKHIASGAPTMFHLNLPADDMTPLTQPITECVSAYFAPNQSEAEYRANFVCFVTFSFRTHAYINILSRRIPSSPNLPRFLMCKLEA